MTGFRNFVMSCALAAASAIPPVAPVQAMPRPALDIEIKAPADVQSAHYRGRHRSWRQGYYGGWGPGYYPRRSGFSFYFGPGPGYYPDSYYFGNRYYYGPRYYGPGYYPGYYRYRHYRPGYYGYRQYRPGYYGYRPYRPYYDGYVRRGHGGGHVTWCLSRYRSYNPATNRYLAYSGVYRVCYSPYR